VNRIGVVLVEPKIEGNIGSVARVMKNFGFLQLTLVNPCKIGSSAHALSVHAQDVLEGARTVTTLNEAISKYDLAVGCTGITSSKRGEHTRTPALTPKELRDTLATRTGSTAIILGREDRGLENRELAECDIITNIPTKSEYTSMNLSHAAAVILYELSNPKPAQIETASKFEFNLLIDHFEKMMEESGYPPHKQDKTLLMLKRIFGRSILTPREVITLRGILRQAEWRFKKK